MQIVPLQPVPSQVLSVILAGQFCKIAVYQKQAWVFCNVSVDDALVVGGVLCHDRCRIVRDGGFAGDLAFLDLRGSHDPAFAGFGTRYQLAYLGAAEVGALA
jgi:hypothetical protein